MRLLINWYRRAKGRYKVPTFAHKELDLHKVFWQVQDKGGYDQVTNLKLWKVSPPHPILFTTAQLSALLSSVKGLQTAPSSSLPSASVQLSALLLLGKDCNQVSLPDTHPFASVQLSASPLL